MKIRARPRKKARRRSRGGGGTAEPSNPDHERRRCTKSRVTRASPAVDRANPVIADVVFSCLVVTDGIHSDTLSNVAGKNLRPDLIARAGYAGSLHSGGAWEGGERCLGLVSNLGERYGGRQLRQSHSSARDPKDAEIGDYHLDHALAGQRQ